MAAKSNTLIRHYVDVRKRPTVVRLDALNGKSDWITSSFYITRDIRNHLQGLRHALEGPAGCGMFLLGQFGSGKSHWLAYVAAQLRCGELHPDPPEVVPLSLLNFRAATRLEDIVGQSLDISASAGDRRGPWSELQSRKPSGLFLVLDELSEFLRSKPDPRAFHEDVRFLQYLGEWCQTSRFWVVAAMQEGIEHTGELEYGLYRKIKDRFPLRFLLSPTHIRDLIQESVLIKQEGYAEALDHLAADLQHALPGQSIDYESLRGLYPIHPATLELLEELRDRFSQARGVVDFTLTQLGGDPSRGIQAFLDRPWGSMLTPDVNVDHFRDLFELQPEFLSLAQQFFPYYARHLPELFPAAAARELAERLLKLLVLVHLSPSRPGLEVNDAASWLLVRVARVNPQQNLKIIERTLQQLVDRGRYVVQRDGVFRIELRDDGLAALEAFLKRETGELREQETAVFEQLVAELGEDEFNPFRLPRDQWQQRTTRWHFHEHEYGLFIGNDTPPPRQGISLCVRLPWGNAGPAAGSYTLCPAALAQSEEMLELAALLRGRDRPWSQDARQRLEGRIKERLTLFRSQLHAAYRDVECFGPGGESETPPRRESPSLRQWLDHYAEWMMRKRFPAFEQFAPGHGPLPQEAYRSLMRFAVQGELGEYEADEYVKVIREAYLVPMRLLTRQGRSYRVPANLERHELVTLIRPMLELQSAPALIYENAAHSMYGLVADQVGLLLVFLHILGELDIRKAGRSYRELFETLPNPLQYDKVLPCSGLNLERLRDLRLLCDELQIKLPKDWTVLAQRRAVRQLREAVAARTKSLHLLLPRIQEEQEGEELSGAIGQLLAWERILHQETDELSNLQQFLFEIGSPRRFLQTLNDLHRLPERLDRVLNERKRFLHLFHYPALSAHLEQSLAVRVEALQTPPRLDQLELVEEWLRECEAVYQDYKEHYRKLHDAWWRRVSAEPIWQWQPPLVASSRHLGLQDLLDQLPAVRQRAERRRCAGLANLDFQPLCSCGFDGQDSPVQEELKGLKALQEQMEQALSLFFRQSEMRERLRLWVEQGMQSSQQTLAYLRGDAPYPDVDNLELLDHHLAGVQLVKEADPAGVLEVLCERTWEKGALVRALAELIHSLPGAQLRFRQAAVSEDTSRLAEWCLEQTLRHGVPLPVAVRGGAADLADRIQPQWVGGEALARLEELGLAGAVIDRVIGWLLAGRVAAGAGSDNQNGGFTDSSLVAAALEVARPSQPKGPVEMARIAERLYGAHETMMRIAPSAWLDRLDAFARTPLPAIDGLVAVLRRKAGDQYLLVDCLGAPLLGPLMQNLESLFPHWQLAEQEFAFATSVSTTDACYRELAEEGFCHKLEKINRVDALVHERFLAFEDFARLAMAELAAACRQVRSRLDPRGSLLVFADHGFRIASDGRSYCHGGDSTLERLVPVLRMIAR